MSSFFDRLFHFRQTESRTPHEDFFTEVFAGILNACPGLAHAFCLQIIASCDASIANASSNVVHARVETQKQIDDGRIDMWIEARIGEDRHIIAIENKTGAGEGLGQLSRYESYLSRQTATTKTLVYITPNYSTDFQSSTKDVQFTPLYWPIVYNVFDNWLRSSAPTDGERLFAKEFLALMEDWNMTISISASDLVAATTYWNFTSEKLWAILDLAWNQSSFHKELSWRNRMQQNLYYQSHSIENFAACLEYGFDFGRSDENWDVDKLLMPSAYVALFRAEGHRRRGQLKCPVEWRVPKSGRWERDGYSHVKEISELKSLGRTIANSYLEFFIDSLNELERLFIRS